MWRPPYPGFKAELSKKESRCAAPSFRLEEKLCLSLKNPDLPSPLTFIMRCDGSAGRLRHERSHRRRLEAVDKSGSSGGSGGGSGVGVGGGSPLSPFAVQGRRSRLFLADGSGVGGPLGGRVGPLCIRAHRRVQEMTPITPKKRGLSVNCR